MRYDNYEKRVKALGNFLKFVYKWRIPIIAVSSVGAVTGVALFSTAGVVGDVEIAENEIIYGQKLRISGSAFIGDVESEYLVNNEWTTEMPTLVGNYQVRLRSENNFGGYYYSDVYDFSIKEKPSSIFLKENQYVTYGDLPKAVCDDLVDGDRIVSYDVIYKDITSLDTSAEIDLSTLVIKNSKGEDVTSSYNFSTSFSDISFIKRKINIDFPGATKEYDRAPLTNDNYTSDELVFGDTFDTDSMASPSITDIGFVSTNRENIIVRNKDGVDVTNHYEFVKKTDVLKVNKRQIVATSEDLWKYYDAKIFNESSFKYTLEGSLLPGDSIQNVTYKYQSQIKATTALENEFSFKIINEQHEDVTEDYYDVLFHYGEFQIAPKPLKISYENTKDYDGKAISEDFPEEGNIYNVVEGTSVVPGQEIKCFYTDESDKHIVDVFKKDKVLRFEVMDGITDVTDCYDITFDVDFFEIRQKTVTLTLLPQVKYYDGTPDLTTNVEDLYSVTGVAPTDTYEVKPIVSTSASSGVHEISFANNPISFNNATRGNVNRDYKVVLTNDGKSTLTIKAPKIDINFNTIENADYFSYTYGGPDRTLNDLFDAERYAFTTDDDADRNFLDLDEVLAPNDEIRIDNDIDNWDAKIHEITPIFRVFNTVTGEETTSNYNINNSRTYTFNIGKAALDFNLDSSKFNLTYDGKTHTINDILQEYLTSNSVSNLASGHTLSFVKLDSDTTGGDFYFKKACNNKETKYQIKVMNGSKDVTSNYAYDYNSHRYYFTINSTVVDIKFNQSDFEFEYDGEQHSIYEDLYLNGLYIDNSDPLASGHTINIISDAIENVYDSMNNETLSWGENGYIIQILDENGQDVSDDYIINKTYTYEYKITPIDLDILFDNDEIEFEYDGKYHSLSKSFMEGEYTSPNGFDLLTSKGHQVVISCDEYRDVKDSGVADFEIQVFEGSEEKSGNYIIYDHSYTYDISPIVITGYYDPSASAPAVVDESAHTVTFTYDGVERSYTRYAFERVIDGNTYKEYDLNNLLLSSQMIKDYEKSGSAKYYEDNNKGIYVRNIIIKDISTNEIIDSGNYDFSGLKEYTYKVNKKAITVNVDSSYFEDWCFTNKVWSAEEAYDLGYISLDSGSSIASTDNIVVSGWEKKYITDVEEDFVFAIMSNNRDVTSSYLINGGSGVILPNYDLNKVTITVTLSNVSDYNFVYDGYDHSLSQLYGTGRITSSFNTLFGSDPDMFDSFVSNKYFDAGVYSDSLDGDTYIVGNGEVSNLKDNFDYVFKYDGDDVTSITWNISRRSITFKIDGLTEGITNNIPYTGATIDGNSYTIEGSLASTDKIIFGSDPTRYALDEILYVDGVTSGSIKNYQDTPEHISVNWDEFKIYNSSKNSVININNYDLDAKEYDVFITKIAIDLEFTNDSYFSFVYDKTGHNFQNQLDTENYTINSGSIVADGVISAQTYKLAYENGEWLKVGDNVNFKYVYNPVTGQTESGMYSPLFKVFEDDEDVTNNYDFTEYQYEVAISPKSVDIDFTDFPGSAGYFEWTYNNIGRNLQDLFDNGCYSSTESDLTGLLITNDGNFVGVNDSDSLVPEFALIINGYDYAANYDFYDRTYTFTINPVEINMHYVGYNNGYGSYQEEEGYLDGDGYINMYGRYGAMLNVYDSDTDSYYLYGLEHDYIMDASSLTDLNNIAGYLTYEVSYHSDNGRYFYRFVSDTGNIAWVSDVTILDNNGFAYDSDNFVINCHKVKYTIYSRDLFTSTVAYDQLDPIEYTTRQEKNIFDNFSTWGFSFNLPGSRSDDYIDPEQFTKTDGTIAYNGESAWVVDGDDLVILGYYFDSNGDYVYGDVSDNYNYDESVIRSSPGFKFQMNKLVLYFDIPISDDNPFAYESYYYDLSNVANVDAKFVYNGYEYDCSLYTLNTELGDIDHTNEKVVIDLDVADMTVRYYDADNTSNNCVTFSLENAVKVYRLNPVTGAYDIDITSSYDIQYTIYNIEVQQKGYMASFFISNDVMKYLSEENPVSVHSFQEAYDNYLAEGVDGNLADGDYMYAVGGDNGGVPNDPYGDYGPFTPTFDIRNADGRNVTDCYKFSFVYYDENDSFHFDTDGSFPSIYIRGRRAEISFVVNRDVCTIDGDGYYHVPYNGQKYKGTDLYKVRVTTVYGTLGQEYDIEDYFNDLVGYNISWDDYFTEDYLLKANDSETLFVIDDAKLKAEHPELFDDFFVYTGAYNYFIVDKRALNFDTETRLNSLGIYEGTSFNPIRILYDAKYHGYGSEYSFADDYCETIDDVVFLGGTSLVDGDMIVFRDPTLSDTDFFREAVDGVYYTNCESYDIFRNVDGVLTSVKDCYDEVTIRNYYLEIVKLEFKEEIDYFEEVIALSDDPTDNHIIIPYDGYAYSYEDYQVYYKNLDGVWTYIDVTDDDTIAETFGDTIKFNRIFSGSPQGYAKDAKDTPTYVKFNAHEANIYFDSSGNSTSLVQKEYYVKIASIEIDIELDSDYVDFIYDGTYHSIQNAIDDTTQENFTYSVKINNSPVSSPDALLDYIPEGYSLLAVDEDDYDNPCKSFKTIADFKGSNYVSETAYYIVIDNRGELVDPSNYILNASARTYSWHLEMPIISTNVKSGVTFTNISSTTSNGITTKLVNIVFDGELHGNEMLELIVNGDGSEDLNYEYSSLSSGTITITKPSWNFSFEFKKNANDAVRTYNDTKDERVSFGLIDWSTLKVYNKKTGKYETDPSVFIDDAVVLDVKITKASINLDSLIFNSSTFNFEYDGEERSFNKAVDSAAMSRVRSALSSYNIDLDSINIKNRTDMASYGVSTDEHGDIVRNVSDSGRKVSPDYHLTGSFYDDYGTVYNDLADNFDFGNSVYEYNIYKREVDIEFDFDAFDFYYDGNDHNMNELFKDEDNWWYNSALDLAEGDQITFITKSVVTPDDSGEVSYDVKITNSEGVDITGNYDLSSLKGNSYSYTIRKRPIDIEFSSSLFTRTYDGKYHSYQEFFSNEDNWWYNTSFTIPEGNTVRISSDRFIDSGVYEDWDYTFAVYDSSGKEVTEYYDFSPTYLHTYELVIDKASLYLIPDSSAYDSISGNSVTVTYSGYEILGDFYTYDPTHPLMSNEFFYDMPLKEGDGFERILDVLPEDGPKEYYTIDLDVNNCMIYRNDGATGLTEPYYLTKNYEVHCEEYYIKIVPYDIRYVVELDSYYQSIFGVYPTSDPNVYEFRGTYGEPVNISVLFDDIPTPYLLGNDIIATPIFSEINYYKDGELEFRYVSDSRCIGTATFEVNRYIDEDCFDVSRNYNFEEITYNVVISPIPLSYQTHNAISYVGEDSSYYYNQMIDELTAYNIKGLLYGDTIDVSLKSSFISDVLNDLSPKKYVPEYNVVIKDDRGIDVTDCYTITHTGNNYYRIKSISIVLGMSRNYDGNPLVVNRTQVANGTTNQWIKVSGTSEAIITVTLNMPYENETIYSTGRYEYSIQSYSVTDVNGVPLASDQYDIALGPVVIEINNAALKIQSKSNYGLISLPNDPELYEYFMPDESLAVTGLQSGDQLFINNRLYIASDTNFGFIPGYPGEGITYSLVPNLEDIVILHDGVDVTDNYNITIEPSEVTFEFFD